MPKAKENRILISGYYGFGNAGDEAVLAAIIEALRQENLTDITVLSANPTVTESLYSVQAVSRNSLKAILREMKHACILISGGGSLFQDTTSLRSIIYYYGVTQLARMQKLNTVGYAQGVGPLERSISRKLTALAFNGFQFITVRDNGSADLLRRIGVQTPIDVTVDPVFALKPAPVEDCNKILNLEGIPNGPFLLACFRPWPHIEEKIEQIAAGLDRYCEEFNLPCVFLPMQPQQDRDLSKQISAKMKSRSFVLQGGYVPSVCMGIAGLSHLVTGLRLHSLIFATAMGIPSLGISYDPKVNELMNLINAPVRLDLFNFTSENLYSSLKTLENLYSAESSRLRDLSTTLKLQAISPAKKISDLLKMC